MGKHHILRFESKHDRLLPRPEFARRVTRNFAAASLLVGISLLGGMLGYHLTALSAKIYVLRSTKIPR